MNPYNYPGNVPQASLSLKEKTKKWRRYAIDFPAAFPTRHPESNVVRGEYYQPLGVDTVPLTILVHGMGDSSVIPCRLLARALVNKGIACFVLYLVFHSSRMPEAVKNRLPLLTAEEWFEGYRVSVIDIRQVMDWAGSRPEINREKIAVFGISLGGLVSAIAMGVDRRISAGVFTVAGGNSEKMIWLSKGNAYRTAYRRTEAEYQQIQRSYADYLNAVAEKGFDNITPARQSFLTDPMTFARYLRQRPVLMINALWDKYVPREAALDFWQACGKPVLRWFPAGHVSIWLWYPVISQQVAGFLKASFAA